MTKLKDLETNFSKDEKKKTKEKKVVAKVTKKYKSEYLKANQLKKKLANSNIFTNVKSVDDGIVYLKHKNQVAKFFSIVPIDLSLSSKQELDLFYYTLSQMYQLNFIIKAYKFDERINLNDNKIAYQKLIDKADTQVKKDILINNKNFIDFCESENFTCASSYYYAIICNSENELKKNINEFERVVSGVVPKLSIEQIDNQKEIYKILVNIYLSDVSLDQLIYYDLPELITPMKLVNQPSMLKIDSKDVQMVAIKTYPPFIQGDYLDGIINLPNVSASITVKDTIDRSRIISIVNKNYEAFRSDFQSKKSLSEYANLELALENYKALIDQLANSNEKIKEVGIVLAIYGTKKERDDLFAKIKEISNNFLIKVDIPVLRQLKLWQCYDLTPFTPEDYCIYVPTITLASGFCFSKSYHNDKNGWMIAEDHDYGLPIFWDLFYLNNVRTSHNVSIVGSTGAGKSFLLKKLILNEHIRGTKIFIFDVENEYKTLIERNGGEYVNLASSSLINPLQVRFIPSDENEDNSILKRHLGFIESFYSNVFESVTEKEKITLIDMTKIYYEKIGITDKTTYQDFVNFKPTDYPIFSDLYIYLDEYAKTTDMDIKSMIPSIRILLKKLLSGQNSIFNGHTTISLNSDLICFNFKDLVFTENKTLANTQILNLLTFLNNEVIGRNDINIKSDKQSVMIVADEFHHFINDDNVSVIKYFDQMARRLRKYKSSLVIATQSPQDMVGTDTKVRNATAIFNNCQYQFTGMLKDNDLQAVDKIYQTNPLTETQKKFLDKCKQGSFLLNLTNKQRLKVNVLATPFERFYMGDEIKEEAEL